MGSQLIALQGLGLAFMWVWWGFWILLFLSLTVVLLRYYRSIKPSTPPAYQKTPLEILKERFAKGEINLQEYEEKKKTLLS